MVERAIGERRLLPERTALAPALNSPSTAGGVSVSSPATTPVSTMVKQYGGSTYVFAVAMRNNAGTAVFTAPGIQTDAAQVLGESRQLAGGVFQDAVAGCGVRLYQVAAK